MRSALSERSIAQDQRPAERVRCIALAGPLHRIVRPEFGRG
jgi:hypothetical protein